MVRYKTRVAGLGPLDKMVACDRADRLTVTHRMPYTFNGSYTQPNQTMSFTTSHATATLTLANVYSAQDAAQLYVDWLDNNPEEIPDSASIDVTAEELLEEVLPYIRFENGDVIVAYDTESDNGNYSSEYFDSISKHFRSIMTSELMVVNRSCYDSRDGSSSGTDYYDETGKCFDNSDISADKKALDEIAKLMSGDVWSPDTLDSIAEIVRGTGRAVDE
jgi:hypothetical protein